MPVRTVKLTPTQLGELLPLLLRAHTAGNRKLARPVDLAETKVGEIMKLEASLDGELKWQLPAAVAEYEFSREETLGVKTALVQAITGVQGASAPAPHGRVKYTVLPLAASFGIEKLVRKEAGLEMEADTAAALTFDDEPTASPKLAPKKVE